MGGYEISFSALKFPHSRHAIFLLRYILLICLVFFLTTTCSPAIPKLSLIVIQLNWSHQAQFAGYYAADQLGYYDAEGLSVKFREGGTQISPLTSVLKAEAQFGSASAFELITARAEGKPVRAIATIYRRNPFVYFSLADSAITSPEKFIGKKILVYTRSRPLFLAMMSKTGITADQYTEVSSANPEDLYSGKIDVAAGFLTNEVLSAQATGHRLNLIFPDDYSIHFYGDTLFTTDDFLTKNPDLVLRFLRATLKGWTFATENPTVVAAMVKKYWPEDNTALETAQMTASLPLINTGEDHIGWMKPEIWAGMAQTLREQKVLTTPLEPMQVYTVEFLEKIYAK